MRIFTQRHYSFLAVTGDKPRAELPAKGTTTEKEIVEAWRAFVANAGTYEVKGNEIHFRPTVAKVPNVMRSGNFAVETFTLEGDTLVMTQKSNQNGPIKNPITAKWTRVE